jgi:hypothetical protein
MNGERMRDRPNERFTSDEYPANLIGSMYKVSDNFGVEGAR